MSPVESYQNMYDYFNKIISWAAEKGASDITFISEESVVAEYMGRQNKITEKVLSPSDLEEIVKGLCGGNLPSNHSLECLDLAHKVKGASPGAFYRFRVNVVALTAGAKKSWQITCRAIGQEPPALKNIHAEEPTPLLNEVSQGLILVSGGTGSGKTTSIAAIVRNRLENAQNSDKVITHESPIEYVYDSIPTKAKLTQLTVGRDVASFPKGIQNAARNPPSVIVVGECRDKETLSEAVLATSSGHLTLMGVQASGVADTVSRCMRIFDSTRDHLDFLHSLSLVTSQILVPTVSGTRIALRETLVFSDDVMEKLRGLSPEDTRLKINDILSSRREGFLFDAQKKFKKGLISLKTLEEIELHTKHLKKRKQ